MKLVTISSQRQITIPRAYLKAINLDVKGKLLLEVKDNKIIAKPVKTSVVDELAGAWADLIPENKKGKAWKEIIEKTMDIVVKELANE